MSDEEQAGHNLSHSKYINLPQCPNRYKRYFVTLNKKYTVDIFDKKLYPCGKEHHYASSFFNSFAFFSFWQKDHVIFHMELDVQMEWDLIFERDL
jgi:hypothetical protein